MYDIRTKMAREILSELRSHFGDRMLKTIVNFNTKIKEASSFGQPVNEYDPASKGHQDFRALTLEIIGSEAQQQSRRIVNSLADQLESIGASANELLQMAKPQPVPPRPRDSKEQPLEQPQPAATTDQKLSEYYGVSQMEGAVVFVTLYPRAGKVEIAGDFNNWQPSANPMEKIGDSGVWQAKIKLPQGKYRYRLVVDGHWQQDPYNEVTEMNPFGEYNSVVEVK
jgi:chromosome partitioning protein